MISLPDAVDGTMLVARKLVSASGLGLPELALVQLVTVVAVSPEWTRAAMTEFERWWGDEPP